MAMKSSGIAGFGEHIILQIVKIINSQANAISDRKINSIRFSSREMSLQSK